MKTLFAAARPAHRGVRRSCWRRNGPGTARACMARLTAQFTLPVFVKPANLGSSVGISKAKDAAGLEAAMDLAAQFDRKIVVEAAVPNVREIEVAVLGNEHPEASVPGEIRAGGRLRVLRLRREVQEGVRAVHPGAPHGPRRRPRCGAWPSRRSGRWTAPGMGRIDFLFDGVAGTWYVSEINTIPGFTTISMYPKLWAATGVEYAGAARPPDRAGHRAARREAAAPHQPAMTPGRAPSAAVLLLAARRGGRAGRVALRRRPGQGPEPGAAAGARLRPRLRRRLRRRGRRARAGLPAGAGPGLRGDRRRRALVAHLPRHRQPQPRRRRSWRA